MRLIEKGNSAVLGEEEEFDIDSESDSEEKEEKIATATLSPTKAVYTSEVTTNKNVDAINVSLDSSKVTTLSSPRPAESTDAAESMVINSTKESPDVHSENSTDTPYSTEHMNIDRLPTHAPVNEVVEIRSDITNSRTEDAECLEEIDRNSNDNAGNHNSGSASNKDIGESIQTDTSSKHAGKNNSDCASIGSFLPSNDIRSKETNAYEILGSGVSKGTGNWVMDDSVKYNDNKVDQPFDPMVIDEDIDDSFADIATEKIVTDASSEIMTTTTEESNSSSSKPRNAQWLAMLDKEKSARKKYRNSNLIDAEAEEESDEEHIAGLEDFGFTMQQQKEKKDDEDDDNDYVRASDMHGVVDDLSDNEEDDEEALHVARMAQSTKEEKLKHKEMLRRMREGYEVGNRSSGNARGRMRYDQLISAGNREGAKRLGLLNADEEDSCSDEEGETYREENDDQADFEEDENALLDKMLKDRFLPRHELDPYLTGDESDEEQGEISKNQDKNEDSDTERERAEDLLAKRFSRRARMQRFLESVEMGSSSNGYNNTHHSAFLQGRLIDEDEAMKQELKEIEFKRLRMASKASGKEQTVSDSTATSQTKVNLHQRHKRSVGSVEASNINDTDMTIDLSTKCSSSLSIALRACKGAKRQKRRAIF